LKFEDLAGEVKQREVTLPRIGLDGAELELAADALELLANVERPASKSMSSQRNPIKVTYVARRAGRRLALSAVMSGICYWAGRDPGRGGLISRTRLRPC